MNKTNFETDIEVKRILRVDHAGEKGAIQIYTAQAKVARWLYPDLNETLSEMLAHEKEHFAIFDTILRRRGVRSCYSLFLWSLGGFLLGIISALLGRRAIGVTTDAVETTVLEHLEWQLDFLKQTDPEVYRAVLSIQANEVEHREWGRLAGTDSVLYRPIYWVVSGTTAFAIWLSTKL
ncbi:MAG: demethoxyubiquinone hydroxylase family protein [Pseudomonadota bacterium]